MFRSLLLLWSISAAADSAAQVLPPPPLPGQVALADRLARSIEEKDAAAYAALLADDLTVFEDGKMVAANKTQWLDRFRPKLIAEGVRFEMTPVAASTGRLLFIEYFNSQASWGPIPKHCCWSHDAVAYDVRNDRITGIRRLRGGDHPLKGRANTIR